MTQADEFEDPQQLERAAGEPISSPLPTEANSYQQSSLNVESSSYQQAMAVQQDFERLAPQYIPFEQRTNYIASAIFGGIIVALSLPVLVACLLGGQFWLAGLIALGWLLLAVFLVVLSHRWPPIKYRHIQWRLGEAGMEIDRGVFWQHRIAVPVARVQHVDVSQGPVQRMFDLGTLTIHTAGTKNSSIELDGLQHAHALRLRDQLIDQKESLDVT